MPLKYNEELIRISERVHELLNDASLHPHFNPPELRQAVLAYPMRGGKCLRPALTAWSCRALGGDENAALHAGLAIELYHTYTLVHDDIIDRDPVRRGKPSVHRLLSGVGEDKYGLAVAEAAHYGASMGILAGDCLQSWSILLLAAMPRILDVDPLVILRIIRRLEGQVGPAIVEGEVRDIQLPYIPVNEVTQDDILRVILTKTAALFGFCAWTGSLLALGREEEDEHVYALSAFAERAGIAFQLQDDVLGIIGDQTTLGKPIGGDLREGKRTLIIALAWERASDAEQQLLRKVLGNPAATPAEIGQATDLLVKLGAVADTQARADQYRDEALGYLEQLPEGEALTYLRELATGMVRREK